MTAGALAVKPDFLARIAAGCSYTVEEEHRLSDGLVPSCTYVSSPHPTVA